MESKAEMNVADVLTGESCCDSTDEDDTEHCHGSTSSSSEDASSSSLSVGGEEAQLVRRSDFSEKAVDKTAAIGWPMKNNLISNLAGDEDKSKQHEASDSFDKFKFTVSDFELMKERFAKLLLGEDMSGCGKGVCTALAISNAITNLCATVFGQLWRLEPLPSEKKLMWRREMEWILCVSDHIVEMVPSWQTFPDGNKLEVMTCRPRSDLYINLPALRKLDNMLLEVLDSFIDPEFWYVDQGIVAPESDDGSASFRRTIYRQEEKWWLPIPRVPPGGLSESSRKQLQHKRECTNQILKAALAINENALAEMDVPESFLSSLPKNGRASLGDMIYRYISSNQFTPEYLLDCLDLSSEHQALEIANRFEAAIYVWRPRNVVRNTSNKNATNNRSSWGMVKDMIIDADKRELLAERAESLLLCLKQRFPGLTQTSLDTSKIQFNKDVGKSILESYSRVLESLAFNIIARIDELLYVDETSRHTEQVSSQNSKAIAVNKVSMIYSVPSSGTPYATAYATPSFSPAPLISPARERSSFTMNRKSEHGFGVKKVLTNYLGMETKVKASGIVEDVENIKYKA